MNRKKVLVFCLFVFLLVSLVTQVSAYIDIKQGSEDIINFITDWGEPFLYALFGSYDSGYLLFEKFLLFILLMAIIYVALSNIDIFEDNLAILWTVSIIVPLLSVRFMNWEWINTILLTYQVLGVALAGLLPFVIFLYFLHNASDDSTVRKIGWIFFIVVYFGLWATAATEAFGEIYFWTMVIAFVFLLFDGTIHRALMKQKWKQAQDAGFIEAIARIDDQMNKIEKSNLPNKVKKREKRRFQKRRRDLLKQIS